MNKSKHIIKILGFDMFVIEFGPVGVFFVTYYLSDFFTAALALGVSTLIALVLSRLVNNRVPWFAVFSGTVTIASSLVTYIYSAPWVLIVKDTVYYFLFATLLAVSLIKSFSLFKTFFGHIFAITDNGWRTLEKRWFGFFLSAGLLNEFVRVSMSLEEWVMYKQLVVVAFIIFGVYQFRVSIKNRLPEADKYGLRKYKV